MKSIFTFILFVSLLGIFNKTLAQTKEADRIIGVWVTADKKGHIEIYKSNNLYYGKLIWGAEIYEADGKTPKKDVNNEDKSKRERLLKNMILLSDFTYNDGAWEDGKVYDPNNGKLYSCTMKLIGSKLHVRGYIGFSLIGRTEEWTRKQ